MCIISLGRDGIVLWELYIAEENDTKKTENLILGNVFGQPSNLYPWPMETISYQTQIQNNLNPHSWSKCQVNKWSVDRLVVSLSTNFRNWKFKLCIWMRPWWNSRLPLRVSPNVVMIPHFFLLNQNEPKNFIVSDPKDLMSHNWMQYFFSLDKQLEHTNHCSLKNQKSV